MIVTMQANDLPSSRALEDAMNTELWDEDGKKVTFGTVLGGTEKSVVVFIRACLFRSISTASE